MAKSVTLTVKVNDQEFKDFVAKYNKFVDRIKDLNDKFTGLSRSVTNVAQQTQKMTDNIKGLFESLKHVHGVATNITKTLGKWATLIQGVVMALGAGVGMFGMDRLARAMTDRRRLQLGFGGDVAETQATIRAGGIMGDETQGILTNIRAAQADPKRARALIGMGVMDPSQPQAKKPEEIFKDLVKKLPEFMSSPYALQRARAFGLTDIFPEEYLMKFQGPKGARAAQDVVGQMDKRPAEMSDEALSDWTKLTQAYKNFTTNLVNRLGERLAPVARNLTKIADGLTSMVNAMAKWKSFQDVFDGLKSWSAKFYRWLYGDKLIDDLKAYFNKILEFLKDPNWNSFKALFNSFLTVLGDLVTRIKDTVIDQIKKVLQSVLPKWLQDKLGISADGKGTTGDGQTPAPQTTPPNQTLDPLTGRVMPGPPAASPPAASPPATSPPAPAATPVPPGADRAFIPGGTQFASLIGGSSRFSMGGSTGGSSSLAFGGGPSTSIGGASLALRGNSLFGGGANIASLRGGNLSLGQGSAMFRGGSTGASIGAASLAMRGDTFGARSRFASLRGGDRNLSPRGGSRFASMRGGNMFASRGGTTNIGIGGSRQNWSQIAQSAIPGRDMQGMALRGASSMMAMGGRKGANRGGLDIDNWQLDRTASLRIDNNPGANPYMAGVSMG
jgi:hypothetical protein